MKHPCSPVVAQTRPELKDLFDIRLRERLNRRKSLKKSLKKRNNHLNACLLQHNL
jgi:hypothetical protein